MIKSFAYRETEQFYITRKSRRFPPSIHNSAIRRLDYLKWAKDLTDLRVPPGNRLEALKGDRAGEYSIRINLQYRVTFKFENGNAYDVKIEDYHS